MTHIRKLDIPTQYFFDEVRDGFYVNGMMKRAWAAQLEILADFDELCTKYGLRYMADWGTLLGTVRHGGYIPWDDDFDVGMPREDYNKFREVVGELGGDYRLLSGMSMPGYKELFGRLVSSHAICLDPAYIDKFHGIPFSLGIDIFVYDHIYADETKERERRELVKNIYALTMAIRAVGIADDEIRNQIKILNDISGHDFIEAEDPVFELFTYMDEIISSCPPDASCGIADYQNYYRKDGRYILPKDIFDNLDSV